MPHINGMPCNILHWIIKSNGRRNLGRPLKRFLNVSDWNRPTSGPTPYWLHNVDNELQKLKSYSFELP
jgi:hypothetical protein